MSTPKNKIKLPVFGIYIGNTTASVAQCKEDKSVFVLTNSYGDRVTPTTVAISSDETIVGEAATNKIMQNEYTIVNHNKKLFCSCDDEEHSFDAPVVIKNGNTMYEVPDKKGTKFVTCDQIAQVILGNLYETAKQCCTPSEETPQQHQWSRQSSNKNHGKNKNYKKHGNNNSKKKSFPVPEEPHLLCVLSVPAYYDEESTNRLIRAADAAKWKVVQVVNEPSVAVLAYNENLGDDINMNALVFRVGGVTCEATVLSIEHGLIFKKSNVYKKDTGADMILASLQRYLTVEIQKSFKLKRELAENERAMKKVRKAAVSCMHLLSNLDTATVNIESVIEGMDYTGSVTISRFNSLLTPFLPHFAQVVNEALARCGLQADEIDTLVLCGGGMKIRKLRSHMKDLVPKANAVDGIETDCLIATGAAIQAKFLAEYADADSGIIYPRSEVFGEDDELEFKCNGDSIARRLDSLNIRCNNNTNSSVMNGYAVEERNFSVHL